MKTNLRIILLTVLLLLPLIATTTASEAAIKQPSKTEQGKTLKKKTTKTSTSANKLVKSRKTSAKSSKSAQTKSSDRFSALVVNASTGRILYEKNAGATRYPASLTKMMTLYLTFEALKKGKLDMNDTLTVSKKAAEQPQTNISLDEGDKLPLKTAIESVVVRSANDSAVVLAETLGGTTWNFALMMTQKARALGMKDTVFRNPNGLPDNQQYTSAYDMAKLGIALRRDFPEYYHFFKVQSFAYNGITYPGHNRVMQRYDGVDGIKTGYIRASGFNLVTSIKKDGYNLVAVIMGGSSATSRDDAMINMLDRTFAKLETTQKTISENQDDDSTKTSIKTSAIAENSTTTANLAHSF